MDKLPAQHLIINLDKRSDRLEQVRKEFSKLGIHNINRLPATPNKVGLIGCGESHKRCLQTASDNEWDWVLICEDDVIFTHPELLKEKLDKYLKRDFDVLLLGANVIRGRLMSVMGEDDIVRVEKSECFHAYIVRCHYYHKLIANFSEGLRLKNKDPKNMSYNIDVYNQKLQKYDKWFCLNPSLANQAVGYSDNFNTIHNQQNRINSHELF